MRVKHNSEEVAQREAERLSLGCRTDLWCIRCGLVCAGIPPAACDCGGRVFVNDHMRVSSATEE